MREGPFFHRLPQKEQKRILSSDMTIRQVLDTYRQPGWCNYPEALAGFMGCWSLITPGRIRKRSDCHNCDEKRAESQG